MQLVKIMVTKQRGKNPYIDFCNDMITCLQQSTIADNDWLEFLKPMAEYIALLMIKKMIKK